MIIPSGRAHQLRTRMPSLCAMSSRRRSIPVALTYFELCDRIVGVQVRLGDEQSIRVPQQITGFLQPNARELLESLVAQPIHSHRLVRLERHRDECVAATRRRETQHVLFGHVDADAVYVCNARVALHTEQLQ